MISTDGKKIVIYQNGIKDIWYPDGEKVREDGDDEYVIEIDGIKDETFETEGFEDDESGYFEDDE